MITHAYMQHGSSLITIKHSFDQNATFMQIQFLNSEEGEKSEEFLLTS